MRAISTPTGLPKEPRARACLQDKSTIGRENPKPKENLANSMILKGMMISKSQGATIIRIRQKVSIARKSQNVSEKLFSKFR